MFVSDASKIQIRHDISIILKKIKAQRPDKVSQLLNQNIEQHLCIDTSQKKSDFNNQHNSAKIFEHGKVSQI